jgi:hypothetical protein
VSLRLGAFVLNAFAFSSSSAFIRVSAVQNILFFLCGQSIFMAILAADITLAISAVLPERTAGTLPFSPNPPVIYGKIAKNFSLLSLCLCGEKGFAF